MYYCDEFHVCVTITQAYFQIESGEDAQEEFGWKLVHGDVFRPPRKGMLLSILLGSGVHVLFMTLATLGYYTYSLIIKNNKNKKHYFLPHGSKALFLTIRQKNGPDRCLPSLASPPIIIYVRSETFFFFTPLVKNLLFLINS